MSFSGSETSKRDLSLLRYNSKYLFMSSDRGNQVIFKTEKFLNFNQMFIFYRYDLEKQEGCDVVAHERLTDPRVTMK